MPFQPGESGNPAGRPRGSCSGRSLALKALDDMLAEESTLAVLKEAMTDYLHKNPIRFFMEIIMPLLPKQAILDLGSSGPIQWVSLMDSCRQRRDQVSNQDARAQP